MKKKIRDLSIEQVIHYCYSPNLDCPTCPLDCVNDEDNNCVRTLMEDNKDISKYKDIEIEVE